MTRSVVITGGTAGIGLATAEHFAKKGFDVAVIGRHQGRIDETVEHLRQYGRQVLGFAIDVVDEKKMTSAAHEVARAFGGIDVWVNNAMATVLAPADQVDEDEYRRVTEVTYLGQVFGTLAALRIMKKQNAGAIIQINSGLGFRPIPLQAAYAAAKAASVRFTDALRSELVHEGVDVSLTTVYLPAVNTTQFLGWARNKMDYRQTAPAKFHDPRACARAIFAVAMRPTREIWIGGSTVMMALLQSVWPGAADRKAASAWDGQLSDEPMARNAGNLFAPVEGDARIDGPMGPDDVEHHPLVLTTRSRHLAVAGLLGLGAVLVGHAIARGSRRR